MNKQILEKVQRNPQLFIEKVLGVETMEAYQASICQDVADYDRVAVSACHAVGKTWLLARIVLWFLYCFPGAKIITTAPTNRQVEMLLWGEIGVAVKNALYNLGGHLTSKKLQIDSDWYAMGFSPAKTAGGDENGEQKGSTFQGWHGDYILIVFDEAVGVPPDVWTQVEGLLTSGKIVKFVCIANPTTKNCDFFELFSMPSWKKVHLSCFDSPNLIANGITNLDE
jgi:phage terminase large subunit